MHREWKVDSMKGHTVTKRVHRKHPLRQQRSDGDGTVKTRTGEKQVGR